MVKLPGIKRETVNLMDVTEREEDPAPSERSNEEKETKLSTVEEIAKAGSGPGMPTRPLPSRNAYVRRKKPGESVHKSYDKRRLLPRLKGSSEATR